MAFGSDSCGARPPLRCSHRLEMHAHRAASSVSDVRVKQLTDERSLCIQLGQQEQGKRLPSAEHVRRKQQQQPLPVAPRHRHLQQQTCPQPVPHSHIQQHQRIDPQAHPSKPLGLGVDFRLRGQRFRVTQPLGKGSFGVVWAAQDEHGHVVALKEMACKSESELGKVTAEGKVLEQVGQEVASAGLSVGAIPTLVSTEVERISQQWRVRLAMSLVPGISLESFLEARRREAKACRPCSADEAREQFADACMCTGQLLMQLAPIIDAFSASVYHRDITPRNVQFQEQDTHGGPVFGLVDFGLAVDARRWRAGEPGAGQLGGDGRYWPASSWFVFCHGTRALEQEAWLQAEYRTSSDAHSLGLTALRCFVEMLPTSGAAGAVEDALQKLRVAWQRYWHDARKLWQPVFDAFRGSGNFDKLRADFTRAKVHRMISDDLCAVRAALRAVQQVCSGQSVETGLAGMPALCQALLLMVQAGCAEDNDAILALEPKPSVCLSPRLSDGSAELGHCSSSTASPASSHSASASSGFSRSQC